MANTRKSMRKIRQVLRLAWETGLGKRQIARSLSMSRTTVGEYLRRAVSVDLSWPLPEALDDSALEALLFRTLPKDERESRPMPDWPEVRKELARKGVTLLLLWDEYKLIHPRGLQYSQFCNHYRVWSGTLDLVMRQQHLAGEKLFVDYAGHTAPITCSGSGEIREAQIFVATLGASNYTYAEATWSQALPDWIASHIRCFQFMGCVPDLDLPLFRADLQKGSTAKVLGFLEQQTLSTAVPNDQLPTAGSVHSLFLMPNQDHTKTRAAHWFLLRAKPAYITSL